MGSRQTRHPNRVDVLLQRGRSNLLGGLMEARLDDLHARIPQRSRHYLDATIMAVEAGFGDENA